MSTLSSLKWGVNCILNGIPFARTFKLGAGGFEQFTVFCGAGIA